MVQVDQNIQYILPQATNEHLVFGDVGCWVTRAISRQRSSRSLEKPASTGGIEAPVHSEDSLDIPTRADS